MSETNRTRRLSSPSQALGLPIAACLLLAIGLLSSLASADTPSVQTVVRAVVGTGTPGPSDIAPPGPITGLSTDGGNPSTVTLRFDQGGGQTITGLVRIAQCKGGITVNNIADTFPADTGNCLDQPLNTGTLHFQTNIPKANVNDTFLQTSVKIGTGTRDVHFDDGGGDQVSTIACDATHPCSLWVQIARTGGNDLVHYDLNFGASTGTTSSTSTTVGGGSSSTTSTTAGGATTSTTKATTSTTGAGGTTSTTAHGTSTTAPATSTTASVTSTTAHAMTTGGTTGGGLARTGSNAARIFTAALLIVAAGWMFGVSARQRRHRLGTGR